MYRWTIRHHHFYTCVLYHSVEFQQLWICPGTVCYENQFFPQLTAACKARIKNYVDTLKKQNKTKRNNDNQKLLKSIIYLVKSQEVEE